MAFIAFSEGNRTSWPKNTSRAALPPILAADMIGFIEAGQVPHTKPVRPLD